MKAAVAFEPRVNTVYVYAIAVVAAAAGLLFGFDIAVINGANIFLQRAFNLSTVELEFAASALLIGCIFGAAVGGTLSDRYGRKPILMLSAILFGLSAVGAALPQNLTQFVIARLLGGLAIGASSVLAPLYIAEVSPPKIRGRLVALDQLAIVTGILVAYGVNYWLSHYGANSWRWMFAAALVPSVAFLVCLFMVPESPRWLTKAGREEEAEAILARVAGPEQAAREMDDIRATLAEESGKLSELFEPGFRMALFVAVGLAILQQVTGINTLLFYGSKIFQDHLGAGDTASMLPNVLIGIVNFVSTILSLWLIEKAGRKALLIWSSAIFGVFQVILGAAFLLKWPPDLIMWIMFGCGAAFSLGLGPCVWVLISEMFPNRIRGRAASIATVTLWAACTALTMTFLSLTEALGAHGTYWMYAGLCFFTAFFVWRWTPETKGKSLEEIERMWHHKRAS